MQYLQALGQFGALGFVAGLVEEGKHVFLVGLHAGLVEWVDAEHITAHAAGFLEEIDELSQVLLGECWQCDEHAGNAAINVSQTGAEFCHLVHLVNALASDVIEAVEVGIVGGNNHLVALLLNSDDCLEDGALAILNPLTH